MTRDDAARKRKARQRAAETGVSYTRAARELDQDPPPDAGPGLELSVVEIRFEPEPVAADWTTPRRYQCWRCEATGPLTRQVEQESHVGLVLDDGATYVLGYCPACKPDRQGADAPSEWSLVCALRDAYDAGQLPDGTRNTQLYVCLGGPRWPCGQAWDVDGRIELPCGPLYDSQTDMFRHPCPYCWVERGEDACRQAHRDAAGVLNRWEAMREESRQAELEARWEE